MTDPDSAQGKPLRRRAEDRIRTEETAFPDVLPPEETQRLLYDLRVHQIELEMQNDELRRTQCELEASRARYFELYDLAPVGYAILSEDGLVKGANLTIAKLLGIARNHLVQQPLTRFILPEDQDTFYRNRKKLLEFGSVPAFELRMRRGGTASFWARIEANSALDVDGKSICRLTISDINVQKQNEYELHQEEARNEALVELHNHVAKNETELLIRALEVAISLTHSEVGYFFFADEAKRSFQLVARSTRAGTHCADSPEDHRPLERAEVWGDCVRQRCSVIQNECPVSEGRQNPSGEHSHVKRFLSVPIFEGAHIVAVLSMENKAEAYDESDARQLGLFGGAIWQLALRKRLETNIGLSEALFRTVVERSGEGIAILDFDGIWKLANPAAEHIFGAAPGTLVGREIWEFMDAEQQEYMQQELSTRHEGNSQVHITKIRTAANEQRDLLITWAPHPGANGQPTGNIGIFRDITEQLSAEEAIRSLAMFPAEDPNPILRVNRQGTLLYFNDAALKFLAKWQLETGNPAPSELREAVEGALVEGKTREVMLCHSGSYWSFFVTPIIQADYANLYAHDITERKLLEETHRFLAQCSDQGDAFFQGLAHFLAQHLGMDYVRINRLEPGNCSDRTLAIHFDEITEDSISHTVQDALCSDAVGQGVFCFPSGVQHRFKENALFQYLKAESFVGSTLWDSSGQAIGMISIIGRRPFENPRIAESVLKLVSLRASGELERLKAEESLKKLNEELEDRIQTRTSQLQRLSARLITAQETERKRIALDLHDSLGQSLSAVKIMGDRALCGAYPAGMAGHMATLKTMMRIIKNSIDEVRRISMALRPSTLDDLGLLSTLSWFTREYLAAYPSMHVISVFQVEEALIPEALKITLFRIVQEAFGNAAKYSQAVKIVISLRLDAGELSLVVEDDGIGFVYPSEREKKLESGHGLTTMKERAELSGGSFTLDSMLGLGTRITARWPVPSS